MVKKIILVLTIIGLTISIFFLATHKLPNYVYYKSLLADLNTYNLLKNEKVIKTFKYQDKDYFITRYYDNSSTWSNLNILLKDKNNYYMLKNIPKCDTPDNTNNIYFKDNILYIHCIGKETIDKYTIKNLSITKGSYKFNFTDTPDINRLSMQINNIDQDYIYLANNDQQIKCSFQNKRCTYIKSPN